jgi:hypothetical protein
MHTCAPPTHPHTHPTPTCSISVLTGPAAQEKPIMLSAPDTYACPRARTAAVASQPGVGARHQRCEAHACGVCEACEAQRTPAGMVWIRQQSHVGHPSCSARTHRVWRQPPCGTPKHTHTHAHARTMSASRPGRDALAGNHAKKRGCCAHTAPHRTAPHPSARAARQRGHGCPQQQRSCACSDMGRMLLCFAGGCRGACAV